MLAPSTISGVAIGRKMMPLSAPRPRNEYRVRASPIIVPMIVAKMVDRTATSRLVTTESGSPGQSNG